LTPHEVVAWTLATLSLAAVVALAWHFRVAKEALDEADAKDAYCEQTEADQREFETTLRNKIEEAAAQRVKDALSMVETMKTATDALLEAARTYQSAEAAVLRVEGAVNAANDRYDRLAQILDSLDRNQGAILASLTNMGVMSRVDLTKSRMVGEGTDRQPPPLRTDSVRATGGLSDTLVR